MPTPADRLRKIASNCSTPEDAAAVNAGADALDVLREILRGWSDDADLEAQAGFSPELADAFQRARDIVSRA